MLSFTLAACMVENFFAITMEGVNSLFSRIIPLSQLSVAGVFFLFCGTDLIVDSGGLNLGQRIFPVGKLSFKRIA